MYVQRCNNSKNYLNTHYQPKPTFLSPTHKFGQRSFSTSSLPNSIVPNPLSGSLRQQIRLQTFKKSLNQSKLNKTSVSRMPLKVGKEERMGSGGNDFRGEVRDLQRENSALRAQNQQLRQQKSDDVVLISRQNQVLIRLQKQINELRCNYPKPNICDCYLIEQHLQTIHSLQLQNNILEIKNSELQQEKHEFKHEIRQLVLQHEQLRAEVEQLRAELARTSISQQQKQQKEHYTYHQAKEQFSYHQPDRWTQSILSRENRKASASKQSHKDRHLERQRQRQILREAAKEPSKTYEKRQEDGRRYLQHLKNIEIDKIANILDKSK